MNIFWLKTKKVFVYLFLIHFIWFLIFLIQKLSVAGFTVSNLKFKLCTLLFILLATGLAYYFWLRKIRVVKKIGIYSRDIFFIGYISSFLYLLFGMFFIPPITLTQIGSKLLGYGLNKKNISFNKMGSNIKLAVIASEDQLFPDHDGFDLKAIKQALKYNKKHAEKQRGGSTISQQTAKNVFLWQGGGFIRKGLEVFYTFSIELLWTKRTILEHYLNIAEMGPGIFGVQEAAKTYFNKNANELTKAEAAKIAACLPSPKNYTVKPLSSYVANRYNNILEQMNNLEDDPDVQEIIKD